MAKRKRKRKWIPPPSDVMHYEYAPGRPVCGGKGRTNTTDQLNDPNMRITCKRCLKTIDMMNLNIKPLQYEI